MDSSYLIMIVIIVGFMFYLQMRQNKKEKQYEEMLTLIEVNDRVTTREGLLGKVVAIDGVNLIVETGPNRIKLKLYKYGVAYITKNK